MELCLIRHGIAADRGAYASDADRPLTDEGKMRMEQGAAGLRRVFEAGHIVSSPLVRARETAEIVQQQHGTASLAFEDALATGDHDALIATLRATESERVALVGHEPHMSDLLSYLLTGSGRSVHPRFKKGAAALVEVDTALEPGSAELVAFLPPKVLRSMG